jgi:hypothetical protein
MGRPERPLDPESGPLAAFAMDLRELRRSAGNISYRELAKRALFSPSVLSAATSGFSLPTLRVTLAFVKACGGNQAEWARRWRVVARATGSVAEQDAGTRVAAVEKAGESSPVPALELALPLPAQLPGGSRHFAGRRKEFAWLTGLTKLGAASGRPPVLVSGPVGIGKSAFAIRWSQQNRAQFPDGLLYADLSAEGGPDASTVLGDFLHALGTPPELVPAGAAQRAALFRSMLAERRVLVLLDNAGDESQLRLLLTEAPRSQILITSRGRLAGLDGVDRIVLDTLPPEQSLAVIGAIAGQEQIAAEPKAALELTELCDHLPLALRAVAVRIAVRRGWTLAHAVAQMRDESRRLDQFRTGDIDLRDRLRAACQGLDPLSRRAFRQVARLRPHDLDAWRLAEALDVPVYMAEELMETLVDAGLAQATSTTGVYRLPRLFRLYAAEEAGTAPGDPHRPARLVGLNGSGGLLDRKGPRAAIAGA